MHKLTIEEMHRLTPEQFREAGKIPLIVVLDNVRSLHNVGAVFRTADAFRLAGVYLCGISGVPSPIEGAPVPSRSAVEEIHKTALGAENTVSWRYFADTKDAVLDLQNEGYQVMAIEQVEGSSMLGDVQLKKDGKYAIIMGHEVFGVAQEVVDMADGCIEIPQYGTKHSLNVSVTAGIVMYTLAMQLLK